jgi:protocatechuate 3,4-dioxygenase beta subunit
MNVARSCFLLTLASAFLSGCGDAVPPAGNYATISGVVTDADSGAPIASAAVAINGVQYARTDAQGKFKVTTVPTGPWSWTATADGFNSGGGDSPPPLTPGEQRVFPIRLKHQ